MNEIFENSEYFLSLCVCMYAVVWGNVCIWVHYFTYSLSHLSHTRTYTHTQWTSFVPQSLFAISEEMTFIPLPLLCEECLHEKRERVSVCVRERERGGFFGEMVDGREWRGKKESLREGNQRLTMGRWSCNEDLLMKLTVIHITQVLKVMQVKVTSTKVKVLKEYEWWQYIKWNRFEWKCGSLRRRIYFQDEVSNFCPH